MTESKVQSKIRDKMTASGWLIIKMTVVSLSGFPDLLCLRNGETLFIECKAPGKSATPKQEHIHKVLNHYGFDVYVIDDPKKLKKEWISKN